MKRSADADACMDEEGFGEQESQDPPRRDEALAAASQAVRGLAVRSQQEAFAVLQSREEELDELLAWGLRHDPSAVRAL